MALSKDAVKLGLMPPMSGLVGIYGTEISRAGQIACQEINENGGVLGRPLELIIEDDGSFPDTAVVAAEKLVDQHQCVAIIGNLLSNSRIAVAYRVAEPRKIPLLNFSFYEGSILSRYFFHFSALPNQQIDKMIPYMKDQFGPRMFFAGNNYEWPRGSIHAAKRILESNGGEVVGEEYCPIGVDVDTIERLLDHVEQSAADVFVPYFAGIDQVNLLTRFTQRGLKNKMKVVMGHYDEMMASQLSAEVREGFYSSNSYFMTVDSEQNRNFLARLESYPGIDALWPKGNGILTNFGEGTYACVKAFAQAVNEAGSLDSEALVESLKNISVASPQGILQMNPDHHHARVNAYLSRCRSDGEFEIIKKFGVIEPIIPERYNHQRITQHATMEEDVRLQARMLEQMYDAVFLINSQEGSILYSNNSAASIYGYSKHEMNGISLSQLNDPARGEPHQVTADFINILNQQGEWKGEVRNIKKDGSIIWCSATASTFTHPVHGEVWLLVHRDITDRKQAEDALATSEEKLRLIHSRVPGILYQFKVDKSGKSSVPYVSPSIENYLGVTSVKIMEDAEIWFDLVHPDDLPSLESSITESMTSMITWDWQGRFIRGDNVVRWLHGSATPEKIQDGSVLWNGLFIDITEQKNSELEIEQGRARFEAMFEAIPDAVIYTDPDRNIAMVNSAALQIFGFDKDELIGNKTAMLYASDNDYKQQGQDRYNPDSLVKSVPYQQVYRCKNGKEFQGETLGTVVRSATGEVLGYLGIIRDITERTQVEAILQSLAAGTSSLKFDSFLNDALIRLLGVYQCEYASISQITPDGKHLQTLAIYANGKRLDNYEYALEGTPCQDVIECQQKLLLHDVSRRYAGSKAQLELGVESFFGAPLVASDGSLLGIISVMGVRPMVMDEWTEPVLSVFATRAAMELERDIINRELMQHREHLEELVDHRTLALRDARDEAEKANLSKSEFLSRMSHELRTPMNAILGFGQLLGLDAADFSETQKENVTEILDAGRHLLNLINEVLDLAKIESGKLELTIESVSIDELLQQCLSLIRPQADTRHLKIINNLHGMNYTVQADRTRLKQVLINLLSNAVKYNSDSGCITLDSKIIGRQSIRIYVTDTGNGLSENEIARLFTAFERLDAVDNIEGTGIGLVISKHLVELMGGKIGVDSSKAKGSTFWFELPIDVATIRNEGNHALTEQSAASSSLSEKNIPRYTVIYIEDNPANLRLVSQLLSSHRENINLLTAHEPTLGLDLIDLHQPDLILLDINLPGMDGYQVFENLKQRPQVCNTPVIAISANAMDKDVEKGMAAGFNDYITKPIDIKQLLSAVDLVLTGKV